MTVEILKKITEKRRSPVRRSGTAALLVMTVLLAAVSAFGLYRELDWNGEMGLTAELRCNGRTEQLACWKNEEGVCFLFLPGYAELSQVRLRTNTFRTVKLDGDYVPDGMTCESLTLGQEYGLVYNGEDYFPLIFLKSENCPALFLDTASGTMAHIWEQKGNQETGVLRLYDELGNPVCSVALDSVKGRGNASWLRSKKPYSLELSQPADLLGMGAAEKWILLANAYDGSSLRNKIAMDLAQAGGLEATPECRWVDLYLNGEYAGLYLLSERNEIHPMRVNIPEGSSFLVSAEPEYRLQDQNYPYVKTEHGTALRIHEGIMASEEIARTLQSVENAILSETDTDPETGKTLEQLVDLDSWARKYLLEEVLANYDAGAVSQFFYGSEGGKVFAGPAWDYDGGLGYSSWQAANPQGILAGREQVRTGAYPWFYGLSQKDAFRSRVISLYRQEFRPILEELLTEGIPRYASRIRAAAKMNAARNHTENTEESTGRILSFMEARMDFLDSYWLEEETFFLVQVFNDADTWGCLAVREGETLTGLPEAADRGSTKCLGWYDVDTEEPFDVTQPITKDCRIALKWESDGKTFFES